MWGELVGDVVYATLPEFDGAHGHQLPSAVWGWGGEHALYVLSGAGVKQAAHLDRQVRQVDVAPTLAYLAGLPTPAQSEGRVLMEARYPRWAPPALTTWRSRWTASLLQPTRGHRLYRGMRADTDCAPAVGPSARTPARPAAPAPCSRPRRPRPGAAGRGYPPPAGRRCRRRGRARRTIRAMCPRTFPSRLHAGFGVIGADAQLVGGEQAQEVVARAGGAERKSGETEADRRPARRPPPGVLAPVGQRPGGEVVRPRRASARRR